MKISSLVIIIIVCYGYSCLITPADPATAIMVSAGIAVIAIGSYFCGKYDQRKQQFVSLQNTAQPGQDSN